MGKIIKFKSLNMGELLYRKYYETASDMDRWYMRETLMLNLHRNNYMYANSFTRVQHILGENTMRELMGYCSAWYITRCEKDGNEYTRKLNEIISRYGAEMMEVGLL